MPSAVRKLGRTIRQSTHNQRWNRFDQSPEVYRLCAPSNTLCFSCHGFQGTQQWEARSQNILESPVAETALFHYTFSSPLTQTLSKISGRLLEQSQRLMSKKHSP